MKDFMIDSRRHAVSRQTFLRLAVGALPGVILGCGTPPYEVEPKVKPTSQPEVSINYYDLTAVPGERLTDRTLPEPKLMYANPVSAKKLLDPAVVLFRDFAVSRQVSGGGSLSVPRDIPFPNRQLVFQPAETTQLRNPNMYRFRLANSRGNQNIGRNRIYNVQELTVERVFHSDQLNQTDQGRRILVIDLEVEAVDMNGVTEEGRNVMRVLNNNYQVVVEMKNPASGEYDLKDVYRITPAK